jgi:hypothetical protein
MTTDRNISSSERLLRHFRHAGLALLAITAAGAGARAHADVMYIPVDWAVPTTLDGIYIDVETLATGFSESAVPGWDINPYGASSLQWYNAAGTGMMRYPGVTTGSAGSLVPGMLVGPDESYGSGSVSVGADPGQWRLNDTNYFGFRFVASDGQTHYGWGSMAIGDAINGSDRRITGIAWESMPDVGIVVGDTSSEIPYDPCALSNPILVNGWNDPIYREIADDIETSCGTIHSANLYRFMPLVDGTYEIRACGASGKVRLAVLSNCGDDPTEFACAGVDCGEPGSSATVALTAGSQIYVAIGDSTAKGSLSGSLSVEITTPFVDAGCSDGPPVFFGPNFFASIGSNMQTVRASADGTATTTMYRVAWLRFVPLVTGAYSLRTCGSTGDSMLAIGTECPPVGQRFEAIAFNDDAPNCSTSSGPDRASFIDATNNGATGQYGGFPLTEDLVAGNTYFILVGSYTAASKSNGILVIDGPPQGSPNDPDADGLPNALDNCPDIFNPNQADCDADGTGDVCEIAAGAADINLDSIPDTCQCIADIFPDGVVNGADLGVLLSQWGPAAQPIAGDINRDGVVSGPDLTILLSGWGPCR